MSQWHKVKLGDVAEVISGQSPPGNTYNELGIGLPFFQGKAEFGQISPTPVKWCTAPKKIAEKGDILMSVRAPVGPTNVAEQRCCIGRGLAAIRPTVVVERDFLLWYFKLVEPTLVQKGHGSTFHAINRADLTSLTVPLPPIADQCRIVDILNRAAGIRRLRREAEEKTRQLIPALFFEMFGDPIAVLTQWRRATLADVSEIRSGITKGRKPNRGALTPVPYLRVANVQDGHLDLSEIKEISVTQGELHRYRLEHGDLLMTEGGDADKLGRAALWQEELEDCIHQNHVFRVRPNRSIVLPEFLRALANSAYGKSYFFRIAKRTTGIATINKTQLGRFPVICAPLPLQHAFVERVSDIQAMAAQQQRAIESTDALSQSLMAKLLAA